MAEDTPPPGREHDNGAHESARHLDHESRRSGEWTGRRLGDFQLLERLGAGGMADVYRAYDTILQREVAVKVLASPLADDPNYVARFRTEARRVAALSHPHLVPIYQAGEGEVNGQHLLYLVMPLLQGSLHDLLRREGRLPYAEAVWLVLQAAEGLEAAHRIGLVHRDVKPENILLDAEGQALVADFGVARAMGDAGQHSDTTGSGVVLGTPEYMAPEQLRGGRVDQRVDIYGLGAVLYVLLTGTLPFSGATPYDVTTQALHGPLVPPTAYAPAIPPALEQVVLTAMARNADDRYASMADFALAARRAVSQQSAGDLSLAAGMAGMTTTLPMPPHAWSSPRSLVLGAYRSRRWILSAVLAAAIVLASLGGAVVALQHRGQDPGSAPNAPGSGPLAQTSPTSTGSLFPGQTPLTTPLTTPRATSTVRIRPTSTPVATATAAPQSTLTITPTPLVLTPSPQNAKTCIATQTVRNNTSDTVGWTWQQPKIGGLHFQIDGGPTVDWPPTTTNAPPGGHNTLVVTADCKPTSVSYAVLVKDSLGGQYTFVMTLQ
jgi:eukaryotic-like serine/threonine-protein kinase